VAITRTTGYRTGLVDLAAGQISREIFVNEEIYQQELERLFARVWLFVGHESQIPKPGDYFVSGMGEESVILCRDRTGKVHVFLNSCRHRGMKVCRYDEGSTPVFTCPYHGWSYGTDGQLVGVPYFKEAYHDQLDKSRWGLIEVPQLRLYKGTVWASWDPSAPPFLEYLGDFARYLDLTLDGWDGGDGGTEILGASRNGGFRATGNSRQRTSAATATTISATARSIWSASALAAADAATCRSGRWPAGCKSHSTSAATRPASICCPKTRRPRPPISTPRLFPTTSGIARRSAGGAASGGG
jgi:nitrite reductase/ring-hydroxylating ferredoxin subunit